MPINKTDLHTLKQLAEELDLETHNGWKNFTEGQKLPNTLVIDIDSVRELQVVVRKIYELNTTKPDHQRISMRAAAGGLDDNDHSDSYSFSACAGADVIIRLVGDDFRTIDSVPGHETHVITGASVQIGELHKALYEYYDLSLPTCSLIPYVTTAGLSANAGHGTGRDQPSFAGLIRAMTLCLPNGEIVRIDATHPDFETIRASHLGLFGIVIDMELECRKAMKIKCTMDVNSVPDFIAKMKAGLFQKYPYVSVMYMPTYHDDELTNKSVNNVIVYAWEPVDKSTPDMNNNPELSHFSQTLAIGFGSGLNLMGLLRTFPSLVPSYMRYFASKIAIGNNDSVAVGPSYDMMHYQTVFPRDLTENGPMFEVSDNDKMVLAFTTFANDLMECGKKGVHPVAYATYMRYFTGTNGGLSMSTHSEGNHVCSIDMTTGKQFPGFDEFSIRMNKFFIGELHARLHWGKNIPDNVDFKKMYGDNFTKFVDVLKSWYTSHGMEFEKSSLLNGTFTHVLTPEHALAPRSPAPEPLPLCTPSEAQKIALALVTILNAENTAEAKALHDELERLNLIPAPSCCSKNSMFARPASTAPVDAQVKAVAEPKPLAIPAQTAPKGYCRTM